MAVGGLEDHVPSACAFADGVSWTDHGRRARTLLAHLWDNVALCSALVYGAEGDRWPEADWRAVGRLLGAPGGPWDAKAR